MPYTYLLFDADDTLFDFQLAQERSLDEVLTTIGLPLSAKDDYKTISHGLWRQLEKQEITLDTLKQRRFNDLLKLYPTTYPKDVEALYEATLAKHDELLPYAKETLEKLKEKYHLVLISNGMPNIQYPRLKTSGLENYFDAIFISDEIGAQKPSTAFFEAVFQKIQVPKEQCLVIGDSPTSDIAGGRNFGLDTCFINFEGKTIEEATYCVAGYKELLALLECA